MSHIYQVGSAPKSYHHDKFMKSWDFGRSLEVQHRVGVYKKISKIYVNNLITIQLNKTKFHWKANQSCAMNDLGPANTNYCQYYFTVKNLYIEKYIKKII